MTLSQETLDATLATYQLAWQTRDADLITSIFTENATYAERAFDRPHTGHEEIRNYWIEKVVGEQIDIQFTLLSTYICGMTAVAEWHATFIDTKRNVRVEMKEVAILEFEGSKITSLREYWQSRKTPVANADSLPS